MLLLHAFLTAVVTAVFPVASSQPSPSPSPRRFEKLPNGNACPSFMWTSCTRVGSLGGIADEWCTGGQYYWEAGERDWMRRGPCKANAKRSEHEARYGPIAQWDVSDATALSYVFTDQNEFTFNQSLSEWDVSRVTSMLQTFAWAKYFNGDVDRWDVSNVVIMQLMFSGATSFNRDISLWDVSNVNNAWRIFQYAQSFNVDLSCWDVSKVSTWDDMFFGARSFDQELCGTHWVNPNRWPKPDNMFVGSNGSIGIEACVAACSGLAPKADDGSGPNPSPKAASSGSSSPSPGVGSNSRGVPSPSSRPESILSIPSQPTESIDSPLLYNIGLVVSGFLGGITLICIVAFVLTLKKNHSKKEENPTTSIHTTGKQGKQGKKSLHRAQSRKYGQDGRVNSHISRNVVEIAEVYAGQKKKIIAVQRGEAAQRVRDRLMHRKGLMSANTLRRKRSLKKQTAVVRVNTTPAEKTDLEAIAATSYRVQVEANRYASRHAEKTKLRKVKSDHRLQERLAARNEYVR